MILFVDIETTGLSVNSARAVSIAWVIQREAESEIDYSCFIVKPDGFNIPPEVVRIHGITTERAKREGISLSGVLRKLSSDIEKYNPYLLVAHNIDFDLPILKSEYSREGIGEPFSNMPTYCTMKETIDLCRIPRRSGGYKWPKLNELHNHLFYSDIISAHDAGSDVRHCAKCFFKLISINHFDLSCFRRQPKVGPKEDNLERYFYIAERAVQENKLETAIKNYTLFIRNNVTNMALLKIAYTNRGLILIHRGSIKEAKEDLLRAIGLGSEEAKKIYNEYT